MELKCYNCTKYIEKSFCFKCKVTLGGFQRSHVLLGLKNLRYCTYQFFKFENKGCHEKEIDQMGLTEKELLFSKRNGELWKTSFHCFGWILILCFIFSVNHFDITWKKIQRNASMFFKYSEKERE